MPRMQGTTEQLELWTRIAAFDLDAVAAELPFSARLTVPRSGVLTAAAAEIDPESAGLRGPFARASVPA